MRRHAPSNRHKAGSGLEGPRHRPARGEKDRAPQDGETHPPRTSRCRTQDEQLPDRQRGCTTLARPADLACRPPPAATSCRRRWRAGAHELRVFGGQEERTGPTPMRAGGQMRRTTLAVKLWWSTQAANSGGQRWGSTRGQVEVVGQRVVCYAPAPCWRWAVEQVHVAGRSFTL